MGNKTERPVVEIALGAIAADGCFCLAFMLHLLNSKAAPLNIVEFLVMGLIACVFLTSCWLIYDDYWAAQRESGTGTVKKLRIKELEQGASIEFDGKSYRVDAINRDSGEIVIERVGQPGNIVVQIEAKG